MWAAALPMLSTQRVLEPPPRGYVAEWQVRLEVAVCGETTVYAAFSTEWQRDIETAWFQVVDDVRGASRVVGRCRTTSFWRLANIVYDLGRGRIDVV